MNIKIHRIKADDRKDQRYKRDAGKPRMSLLFQFPRALKEVVRAAEYGAEKYGERTWDKVENGVPRYLDAMMRHPFDAAEAGDLFSRDRESGRLHMAHEILNALMLLELHLRGQEKPGGARYSVRQTTGSLEDALEKALWHAPLEDLEALRSA